MTARHAAPIEAGAFDPGVRSRLEHAASPGCWCGPSPRLRDLVTGDPVWLHGDAEPASPSMPRVERPAPGDAVWPLPSAAAALRRLRPPCELPDSHPPLFVGEALPAQNQVTFVAVRPSVSRRGFSS